LLNLLDENGDVSVPAEEKPWFKNWPSNVPKHLNYPDVPLFELLRQTAKKHPEKLAIAYLGREITYAKLDALSDQFATALVGLGIEKNNRVALFLPNIPQFIIAYYGILKAGAVLTTISPLHREREVEYQLSDSEAKAIVTLDSLFPITKEVLGKTLTKDVVITSLDEYGLEEYSNKPFSQKTSEQKSNVHSFQQMLQQKSQEHLKVAIDPVEDLAALQYTGGTTGTAKAAMLTHKNLVSNAIAFATWIRGKEAQETFLAALPLFHIYGMTTSLNVPISLAATMVMMPRFEPAKALASIQAHRVSVFCGVPTMYQALLVNPDLCKHDLTSIRVCISGASPLPPQVQKKFMEITGGLLAEGYGLTEASPVTHCNPVNKTLRTVKIGSIGLPLPDTEARIVDSETGTKTLPVGETGELAVKGPQVMRGYWRQPQETALVLRTGWLLTGDIARMDADGYFYITDRKKDLIKTKGYSVYPRELEDVLYEHPAVKLCAVVGKPDQKAGEVPKAFVVLKEGAVASAQEITGFVNGKVASYKAVRELEFRKDLPLSSAGKVLRRILYEEEKTKAVTQ
jgi:long-chain acyl-CoA synthetase